MCVDDFRGVVLCFYLGHGCVSQSDGCLRELGACVHAAGQLSVGDPAGPCACGLGDEGGAGERLVCVLCAAHRYITTIGCFQLLIGFVCARAVRSTSK